MVAPPKQHAIIAVALGTFLLVVALAGRSWDQTANAASVASPAEPTESTPPPIAAAPPAPPPALPTPSDFTAPVRSGDNLAKIFDRHGFHARDLYLVVHSGPFGRRLAAIRPGHEFDFSADEEGNLQHLRYRPDRLKRLDFRRIGDRFEATETVREPDFERVYKAGRIHVDQSLFTTCKDLGLSDAFAIRLAELFQWDIDFVHDVRPGDEFHVLYDERRIDGEFIGYGEILAAEFVTRRRSHQAVRYVGADGVANYYAPGGNTMRKRFVRTPLDARVSSPFNLKRVHPLWKRVMPHRGIDYAAPTGTAVKATGDGKVITRSRTRANGNYVVIQHGERYQTKYLHLSGFAGALKTGQRVKQGEVIGYVGATGWATGPHLHYEFLVDGVHKNPSTVGLPDAEPIADALREDFLATTAPLLADLQARRDSYRIAFQTPGP
ncbi:MAG: peptidoglycan DD-metalloendopeptidase family protein [Gammaproteobacteria bacterium]|nr:peptidoglycan DD-metalloendopeptidase family protein [Gammaproteobacteria bacterium]